MEQTDIVFGRRKRASDLIFAVLTEKISVLVAIRSFPPVENDKSLEAAWHALMHYEADEDIRKIDREYTKMQDDFLEYLAFELAKGKDLPVNIIADYTNFYKETPTAKKHGLADLWGIFDKKLNIEENKKGKTKKNKPFKFFLK